MRTVTLPMILNDLEGHSLIAGLFKRNFTNILQHFARFQLTCHVPQSLATAELLVLILFST